MVLKQILGAHKKARESGLMYTIPSQEKGREVHKQIQKEAGVPVKSKKKKPSTRRSIKSSLKAAGFTDKELSDLKKKHKSWSDNRAKMQKMRSENPEKYRRLKKKERRDKLKARTSGRSRSRLY
tara:strand:+ start:175 stop:546 length:372 start_codon:yes stop_codon:yes gene_type:complete